MLKFFVIFVTFYGPGSLGQAWLSPGVSVQREPTLAACREMANGTDTTMVLRHEKFTTIAACVKTYHSAQWFLNQSVEKHPR